MASLNDGGTLILPTPTRVPTKNKELERVPLFLTETLTGQEDVREGGFECLLLAAFHLLVASFRLPAALVLPLFKSCLSGLVLRAGGQP